MLEALVSLAVTLKMAGTGLMIQTQSYCALDILLGRIQIFVKAHYVNGTHACGMRLGMQLEPNRARDKKASAAYGWCPSCRPIRIVRLWRPCMSSDFFIQVLYLSHFYSQRKSTDVHRVCVWRCVRFNPLPQKTVVLPRP